jgi:hypothetical protein
MILWYNFCMPKDKDSKTNVQDAIKEIKQLPQDSMSEYAHGSWSTVKLPQADRVLTDLNLNQLVEAFINDQTIEIEFVSHYGARYVSRYNHNDGGSRYDHDAKRNFLLTDENGAQSAVLIIEEVLVKKKLRIIGIEKQKSKKIYGVNQDVEGEYWKVLCFEKGYTEHNYNAGYSEWTQVYSLTRHGNKITWERIKES